MTMLPAKIIIQLILIILVSFIIILNTIHLLPTNQEVVWSQPITANPVDISVYGKTPSHRNIDDIVEEEQARSSSVANSSSSVANIANIANPSCISSCLQHLDNLSLPLETGFSQSLCGYTSNRRGNHQKVVSCSFYGDMKHGYFQGITDNLDLMQDFYPGWVFRLYIDSAKMELQTRQSLCSLSCVAEGFDLCPVNSLPKFGDLSSVFGMTWRFLPLSDPTVDIMVSRDLDSRFTAREQAAVSEWLQSELPFHSMRDNQHHGVEILGGMWGARLDTGARESYHEALKKLLKDAAGTGWYKGLDQTLLTRWIWPQVQKDAMVHDSYLCKRFKSDHWRPWPTQRVTGPYNFVGAAGPMEIKTTCPEECRPADHKDWTMC